MNEKVVKFIPGQKWVWANLAGAKMGPGKFGLGQIWLWANLDFGQTWLGKIGPGRLGQTNLGWAKMARHPEDLVMTKKFD